MNTNIHVFVILGIIHFEFSLSQDHQLKDASTPKHTKATISKVTFIPRESNPSITNTLSSRTTQEQENHLDISYASKNAKIKKSRVSFQQSVPDTSSFPESSLNKVKVVGSKHNEKDSTLDIMTSLLHQHNWKDIIDKEEFRILLKNEIKPFVGPGNAYDVDKIIDKAKLMASVVEKRTKLTSQNELFNEIKKLSLENGIKENVVDNLLQSFNIQELRGEDNEHVDSMLRVKRYSRNDRYPSVRDGPMTIMPLRNVLGMFKALNRDYSRAGSSSYSSPPAPSYSPPIKSPPKYHSLPPIKGPTLNPLPPIEICPSGSSGVFAFFAFITLTLTLMIDFTLSVMVNINSTAGLLGGLSTSVTNVVNNNNNNNNNNDNNNNNNNNNNNMNGRAFGYENLLQVFEIDWNEMTDLNQLNSDDFYHDVDDIKYSNLKHTRLYRRNLKNKIETKFDKWKDIVSFSSIFLPSKMKGEMMADEPEMEQYHLLLNYSSYDPKIQNLKTFKSGTNSIDNDSVFNNHFDTHNEDGNEDKSGSYSDSSYLHQTRSIYREYINHRRAWKSSLANISSLQSSKPKINSKILQNNLDAVLSYSRKNIIKRSIETDVRQEDANVIAIFQDGFRDFSNFNISESQSSEMRSQKQNKLKLLENNELDLNHLCVNGRDCHMASIRASLALLRSYMLALGEVAPSCTLWHICTSAVEVAKEGDVGVLAATLVSGVATRFPTVIQHVTPMQIIAARNHGLHTGLCNKYNQRSCTLTGT